MNSATCAALSAVYPIVLLTLVIDRERLVKRLRERRWYKSLAEYAVSSSLLGLPYAIVGIQVDGYAGGWAVAGWVLFAIVFAGLFMHVAGLIVSAEIGDADSGPTPPQDME